MNPRPWAADTELEAFGSGTAPILIGHVSVAQPALGKFASYRAAVASNRHMYMAFAIDFAERAAEALKTPSHIANLQLRLTHISLHQGWPSWSRA